MRARYFRRMANCLAFRTQTRAGYESDLWRLAVMDLQTNAMTSLTDSLDRWVESYTWSADSKRLFFTIDDHGSQPLMMIVGHRRTHPHHRTRSYLYYLHAIHPG